MRDAAAARPASGAVRAARVDLAAALRLAARLDLHEGICNHFSLRLSPQAFLINPFGVHWLDMRASDLLLLDAEGRVLEGEGEVEKTAFHIHSRMHLSHREAACVMHTHMPYASALTLTVPGRLEMAHQNALRFWNDIAYDDVYNGLVLDAAEGDRLAAALGSRRVMLQASHGAFVVGPSVGEAFDTLYYLERAARLQVLALATGRPLRRIDEAVCRRTFETFRADTPKYAAAHFESLKRRLAAAEPAFAD